MQIIKCQNVGCIQDQHWKVLVIGQNGGNRKRSMGNEAR